MNKEIKVKNNIINNVFKRLFDMILSIIALIVFLPLLFVVSLIIKISDGGPVLFKDKRVGKKGKDITVYKFRSMYVDAESKLKEYLTPEQLVEWQTERKIINDPRITKVGKFIRKTSIDELPQLINVIIGNMSLVGVRPLSSMEVEKWFTEEDKRIIFSFKPGITGYWQAYGRSDITFESGERQKMDIIYATKANIFFDLKIMIKTVFVVLFGKGAR